MRENRTLRLTWRGLETWPWWNCAPIPQSKERNWKPSTYSRRACPRPYRGGGHATPFGPTVPTLPLQWLIRQFEERMIVLSDTAFHAAEGDPTNLKLCQRGAWEDRMLVETVLSMLTLVRHGKKVMHRVWTSFHARLACTMAAFHVLVQWHGFQPNASGFVPLSMAEFSL